VPKPISCPVATILAVLLAGPALGQGAATGPAATDPSTPASPSPATPATPGSSGTTAAPAPAAADTNPAAKLPGVTETTNNPNLAVATIKLENGKRLSKIIGADVYGQDGKPLGKIDDLVMSDGDHVTLAVVAVGGFLGLGSKLIAFPFTQLKTEGDRLTLPGVTSDTLNGLPNFQY
jgi:sporulation protein YlmC with PRC-barrel domain